MNSETDTGVSLRFKVGIDSEIIGEFSSCEGLGVEVVLETREEGGNNGMVWQLPTRLKYPNLKLSRPIGLQSRQVLDLFNRMINGYSRDATGTVTVMSANGSVKESYTLTGVMPVRWTGPSLKSESVAVVTETLELSYQGITASAGE